MTLEVNWKESFIIVVLVDISSFKNETSTADTRILILYDSDQFTARLGFP